MVKVDWQDDIGTSVDHALVEKSLNLSLRRLNMVDNVKVELMITDLTHIQKLNREHRAIDAPTDVLSFELPKNPENLLGSVVICQEIAAKQAQEAKISLSDEISQLANHGLLHLLGYNHV